MDREPPPASKDHDLYRRAGEFTLGLVKVLAQAGPEPAPSRTAAQDLYAVFREVTRDAPEVSYVLTSHLDDRGVLLEGLTPEPIEVVRTLSGMMGELFVRKLHEFFVRNRIALFTIKRSIDQAEFSTFLDRWAAWPARLESVEGRLASAWMNEELTRQGILGVIVVGMDEVPGAHRHLAWTPRVALARVRNDLKRLAELRRARPEALARMRCQVIADALAPIRKPETLCDLLVNLDLIAADLTAFTQPELERLVVDALPRASVPLVAPVLMERLEAAQHATPSVPEAAAGRATLRRIATGIAAHLVRLATPETYPILEKAHSLGLVEVQALPDELRRKVKARELCDRFLASPDLFLKDFEFCAAPKSYLKYLNVFAVIVPELIRRREVSALSRILEIFDRHLREEAPPFVGRSRFLEETLAVLERGGVVAGLIDLACTTPKEARQGLEVGTALFRGRVVPGLVAHLGAEDVSRRAAAVAILSRIGADAVPAILEELRSHRHPWFTVRNLIAIVGDSRSRAGLGVLQTFVKHPHPKVREELVDAFAKILGDEAERALLAFLNDENPVVARRAIHHLGLIRSTAPAFLRTVTEAIRVRSRSENEPDEALQAACLAALLNYEYQLMPENVDLEGTLIEIVRSRKISTLLPGRLGTRAKSIPLQVAAIRALGVIGTGRALGVLGDLVAHKSAEVRHAAGEAAEQIRTRLTSQVTQSPLKF